MNVSNWKSHLRFHLVLAVSAGAVIFCIPILGGGVPTAAAQSGPDAADNLTKEVKAHLAQAQVYLDQVVAVSGPHTIENTLGTLNKLSIELDAAGAKAGLLENVHPDKQVREAAEKSSQEVSAFITALSLNRGVYDAVLAVDVSGADANTQRLKEKTLRDYRRSGVDKDEATRVRITELKDEILLIGQEFQRNIRDDSRFVLFDSVEDLAGLPQDYIDNHPADENGKIKVTTAYPDYLPFVKYGQSTEARKRLYEAFNNRGYPKNIETFNRLLAARYELARLLGYDNWAEYITDDKMVGSASNAQDFVTKLDEACRERAERDVAALLKRKQKDDPSATVVQDYEKSYYQELVKGEEYNFDSQELRAYFPYDQVKQGIFDLTSTLFSVRYVEVNDAPKWHESVECYDIFDGDTKLGRFYLDMHPRDGKYGHAAQFGINTGVKGVQKPVAALICNFPGGDDSPGLMEHGDVETFLHEFGHLLHTIFGGNQEWIDFSGVATEWDFVEAPSQMLEEWSADWSTLVTFAKHYETGEPISKELVAKLRAAQDFGKGIYVRQQNFYSALSLNAYNQEPSKVDMDALVPELQAKYSSFPYVEGTHMQTAFGHLEGYSAMYYTYMWSLVIAKDMFSKFDKSNMLDPKVATAYRKQVLEQGGTKDAADLVQDFLGRPYGFESFRAWLNSSGDTP